MLNAARFARPLVGSRQEMHTAPLPTLRPRSCTRPNLKKNTTTLLDQRTISRPFLFARQLMWRGATAACPRYNFLLPLRTSTQGPAAAAGRGRAVPLAPVIPRGPWRHHPRTLRCRLSCWPPAQHQIPPHPSSRSALHPASTGGPRSGTSL